MPGLKAVLGQPFLHAIAVLKEQKHLTYVGLLIHRPIHTQPHTAYIVTDVHTCMHTYIHVHPYTYTSGDLGGTISAWQFHFIVPPTHHMLDLDGWAPPPPPVPHILDPPLHTHTSIYRPTYIGLHPLYIYIHNTYRPTYIRPTYIHVYMYSLHM